MSLKEGLSQIDDEYLTGISNKGILKRAYKDLEQADIKLTEKETAVEVIVDDCTCELVWPVAESKCSCPSRSVCKHIVMAVLYTKNKFENSGSQENIQENIIEAAIRNNQTTDTNTTTDTNITIATTVNTPKDAITSSAVINSIDLCLKQQYSLDMIQKKLGRATFKRVMEYMLSAPTPKINVTSIITVYFEDTDNMVKLIEPVEYSTCSCHKKELCVHKAQAILYYQLDRGYIKKSDLEAAAGSSEKQIYDMEKITELISSMRDMIAELMFSGLSRSSNEVVLSCERMALMCHNLLLYEYEKRFRSLSENLDLYFKRHASFSLDRLMREITQLYTKIAELEIALEGGDIAALAGQSRSEYTQVRPLNLIGMGSRFFHSKTGYEGETIYFLEENTRQWYTYTDARPVFYENKAKNTSYQKKPAAPWGLTISLEELAESAICLTNGKVNDENRLSSTSEAKAQVAGKRRFLMECAESLIYDDFETLFEEKFGDWYKRSELTEVQKLVIVRPEAVQEAEFDIVSQSFSMILLDKAGHKMVVRVSYSKEESNTIKYLERLYGRIQKGLKELPLFFGIVYIEGGQLRLYPIEDYER